MDQFPPLHWLSPARSKSVLLPGYARLERSGQSIIDDALLDPPLTWIDGVRPRKSTWSLPISAYELLRRSAAQWLESEAVTDDIQREGRFTHDLSSLGLPPHKLLEIMPPLQWPTADTNFRFFSPRIAIDSLPTENFRAAWNKWIIVWARKFSRFGGENRSMLTDPYAMMQESYRWICELLETAELESEPFAAALTSFSLGALGAFPRIECQVCFRLAIPQRVRCEHHHSAMIVHGDDKGKRSNISQSARAGKQIAQRLDWDIYRPTIGQFFLNPIEERTVSELLWGFPPAGSELLSQLINVALLHAPDIVEMLPPDFQNRPLPARLAILRSTLDPREWISRVWPDKIMAAQAWFKEFKAVAPGTRSGPSIANQERLQQIDSWLAAGVKKSEIALRLEISRSHLSKILSRRSR